VIVSRRFMAGVILWMQDCWISGVGVPILVVAVLRRRRRRLLLRWLRAVVAVPLVLRQGRACEQYQGRWPGEPKLHVRPRFSSVCRHRTVEA
jgi:hypothetical protein